MMICESIKALLGMLMRLPWERRSVLVAMDGKHRGVYVEYVSLMVSCYWLKVFIITAIDIMVKASDTLKYEKLRSKC